MKMSANTLSILGIVITMVGTGFGAYLIFLGRQKSSEDAEKKQKIELTKIQSSQDTITGIINIQSAKSEHNQNKTIEILGYLEKKIVSTGDTTEKNILIGIRDVISKSTNENIQNQRKKDFEKIIDAIVLGPNPSPYFDDFNNFIIPEINDEQLKYIYETVLKHPLRTTGLPTIYDFLSSFAAKKSKYADKFYVGLLRKNSGLSEVERSLIYNCFKNDDADKYENELADCILRGKQPMEEFIGFCNLFSNSTGYIKFLNNLMNDKKLINSLDKEKLTKYCSGWQNPNNFMSKLYPSWKETYISILQKY